MQRKIPAPRHDFCVLAVKIWQVFVVNKTDLGYIFLQIGRDILMRFAFHEHEIVVVGPQSRQEREVMLQLAGGMW